MSEQEEVPVWHAIVGDDWEPVLFGDQAEETDEVLVAKGWAKSFDDGGFIYRPAMIPRRRRKRFYDIFTHIGRVTYCRIKGAKPGDRFTLTKYGELVPIKLKE